MFKKIGQTIWQILKSARPRQWLKNLSLFAPIIFSGQFFDKGPFTSVFLGFVIFCLASSAAYMFNDLVDLPKDRSHPFKRLRPLASGKLSPAVLVVALLILTGLSASLAVGLLNRFFLANLLAFLLLQLGYSLFFRSIIIADALAVALAFILRVFAGSFASQTSISSWLILATIGVSLLLAFGKRRSERTLMGLRQTLLKDVFQPTRATLLHYPDALLDSMISMSASFAIISYSLFSFQISPRGPSKLLANLLPPTLAAPKWMMLTIPFVIYGVARYLYVIYEKKEGESPERVLLSDFPLLSTVIGWVVTTVLIIYFLGT
ncbi:MAG: decaprenyl-phosphate phosphoribosyltransferase [Patescibacteria group bacterium]|nr:decaprenyl-phosphate phosphoribosyltransferase [Patescibacteria group bacterium]